MTYYESDERVRLEEDDNKVKNAKLIIDKAELSDRAQYTCVAKNMVNDHNQFEVSSTTFVRVKGIFIIIHRICGIYLFIL